MFRSPSPQRLIERLLWDLDLGRQGPAARLFIRIGRLLYALVRDLNDSQLTLYAMSLVYTTLLSLVPLLAVSFSVLKGFGVHNQLEPVLVNALEPLGDLGIEIARHLVGFVDRVQVGVLGALGLGMLFYTVLSVVQKIEQAFNYVWRVDRQRPLAQRFVEYLSVLTVGPVLFFSAIGVSASLGGNPLVRSMLDYEAVNWMMQAASLLAPYLMISATFTFVYRFVPNTEVRLGSAAIGGFIAGLLWETVGGLFGEFMAGSTQYTAIYSSLAILILLMLWVYLAWVILLIGSDIAFYHQHPEHLDTPEREPTLSLRQREQLALLLAGWIARAYLEGRAPPDRNALARRLRRPARALQPTLTLLEEAGYIAPTATEPPGYVLRRPPETIPLLDLLEKARRFGEGRSQTAALEPAVAQLMGRIDQALAASLEGLNLRLLAEGLAQADLGQVADQDDGPHDEAQGRSQP